MNKLYKDIIQAKNSSLIPLFPDGKPMHSKYNPEQEGSVFASTLPEDTKAVVVLGLGGGYHIQAIAERFSDAKILVFENSNDDIELLSRIPCVKKLLNNENIIISAQSGEDAVFKILADFYVPALYGNLNILSQRVWAEENKEKCQNLTEQLKKSIKLISQDYSVQSHFGKIWQHNIISNLIFYDKKINCSNDLKTNSRFCTKLKFPVEKTAAIIAAGPTLDKSVIELKNKRNSFYIIATDTTYGTLLKHGINPDAVVSIDGQNVSHTHFMHSRKDSISAQPLFVFDLCANTSAVRSVYSKGGKILFVKNAHPLSALAGDFLQLDSGAGTVTIAACDFALKAGFSAIKTFGADFSYSLGKPYTKGTYLDQNFNTISDRLNSSQMQFTKLMYRTPLIPVENKETSGTGKAYTTEVLQSYRKTFESWKEQNLLKNKSSETAVLEIKTIQIQNPDKFSFKTFIKKFNKEIDEKSPECIALLPYVASLRKNSNVQNLNLRQLLKLAQSAVLRYNFLYEK